MRTPHPRRTRVGATADETGEMECDLVRPWGRCAGGGPCLCPTPCASQCHRPFVEAFDPAAPQVRALGRVYCLFDAAVAATVTPRRVQDGDPARFVPPTLPPMVRAS